MVGLGGLEPPTSPLSGARSSHLSYRPQHRSGTAHNLLIVRWFSVFRNSAEMGLVQDSNFSDPLTVHDIRIALPSVVETLQPRECQDVVANLESAMF